MNPKEVMAGVEVLIKAGQSKILTDVQHTLAGVEMEKRERAIIDGLQRLPSLELTVAEILPDMKAYQASGEPAGEPAFSEKQLDRLTKAKAALTDMTNALNKAINEGEYDDLFELNDGSPRSAVGQSK